MLFVHFVVIVLGISFFDVKFKSTTSINPLVSEHRDKHTKNNLKFKSTWVNQFSRGSSSKLLNQLYLNVATEFPSETGLFVVGFNTGNPNVYVLLHDIRNRCTLHGYQELNILFSLRYFIRLFVQF